MDYAKVKTQRSYRILALFGGASFGWVTALALILSCSPATSGSLTINKCMQSTDGTRVCQPACPIQGGDAAPAPPGTLASLLAEGYEIHHLVVPGGGTVILRKKWSYTPTYICDRGPIGSPADKSFITCKYDQVPCSLAPDRY
jgi:hypothetical protein